MATISAYASTELKRQVERIVREEGRSQAQVAATALELYCALPPAARRAYIELRAASSEVDSRLLARVHDQISRVLFGARWERLSARIDRELDERAALPEGELSEEEIARIAVDMSRDPETEGHRRAG